MRPARRVMDKGLVPFLSSTPNFSTKKKPVANIQHETKLGKKFNGGVDVFNHNADVVHTLYCHEVSFARG